MKKKKKIFPEKLIIPIYCHEKKNYYTDLLS
jgi:hypothetical protein